MAFVVAVTAEYFVAAVLFDGGTLEGRGGWIRELRQAGELVTLAVVVITAGLVINAAAIKRNLAECATQLEGGGARWAAIHGAGYGVAMLATSTLFGLQRSSAALDSSLALLAFLAEALSLAALLRALFGRGAWPLARALGRVAIAGMLLGACAWLAGIQLRPLWPLFARGTLTVAAWLLRSFGSDVSVDEAAATLAMSDFEVTIAPACSGVEGMALVAIFLGFYVLRFRSSLRVGRAVSLIVLAVALAWAANALRIAGLVALGAYGFPDVAFGGFHSKAGWVLFCCIALSMVTILHRSALFVRADATGDERGDGAGEDNPTADYCVPFLTLLAASLITGLFAREVDFLYPLHALAALLALVWARKRYPVVERSVSWLGIALGFAVFGVWAWFTPVDPVRSAEIQAELHTLSVPLRATWWAFRLLGTSLIVPIVEELAFRGFLQRRLVAQDFTMLPYRQVSAWGVAGSAILFGALHASWWLGGVAGLAYSLASIRSGRLESAIWAHATTNTLLAAWALAFGRLDLLV